MSSAEIASRARESFDRRAWETAFTLFRKAEAERPLDPDDLDRLGAAAHLTGREDDCIDAWARAHHAYIAAKQPAAAVRCAFWVAFNQFMRGDVAPAGGWLARAARLVQENGECAEAGYLLIPQGIRTIEEGDPDGALAIFDEALAIARRYGEADLEAIARHGHGRALLVKGEARAGMTDLDEAMVAVTSGATSPIVAGVIYCSVLEACRDTFDVQRARQWTSELTRWCDAQPDLVPFRGQCLVHRAEIMELRGSWSDALKAAEDARVRLTAPPGHPAAGEAWYRLGEIHRLRGEFADAEQAYRSAAGFGRSPQPGLALLRLAEGRIEPAASAIRSAMDEAGDGPDAWRLWPAAVEVALAAGDIDRARATAERLSWLAARYDTALLRASSDQAAGSVLLAGGEAKAAVAPLRQSVIAWLELDAPYEAARARLLLGRAYRAAGDEDSASVESEAGRAELERLGVSPPQGEGGRGGLTPREVEIVRLVAAGKTNRAIAGELVISEKTVARHVSNIFVKLGISSRSAATAYAYEHGIIGGSA